MEDVNSWEYYENYYYYKYFPEFRLIDEDTDEESPYLKADLYMSPDDTPPARKGKITLRCHSTDLYKCPTALFDNGKTMIVHPWHINFNSNGQTNPEAKAKDKLYKFFYEFEDGIAYKISLFFQGRNDTKERDVFCEEIEDFNPYISWI